MTQSSQARTADFWFDPSCPFTWLTSRWLLEAAAARSLEVRWHLMSLSVLNEGRDEDPENDPEGYLWVPVRICAAVLQQYGQEALAKFYTALWTNESEGSPEEKWLNDLQNALESAGLPKSLSDAGMNTDHDEAVRASHREAMDLIGKDVGTPVIAVEGSEGNRERRTVFFGPVISQVPTGEAAGRLWDGVLLVAGTPGFHELKATPPKAPA
ncbi:DsbA family protein [Streptomyces albidus (ex Kaewkla and Franco 2022)]|uniref:DsbA family protein n=1 Tax=Streptomyces albidus (ex Kaewkla and Franco 2022) TaxID=722709 RepID=UPI0015EE3B2F|nr:DsbA family protein [Streptomyces albidus (ex Kaewkla and Franco 2022)]